MLPFLPVNFAGSGASSFRSHQPITHPTIHSGTDFSNNVSKPSPVVQLDGRVHLRTYNKEGKSSSLFSLSSEFISAHDKRITDLAPPSTGKDAATKEYVDEAVDAIKTTPQVADAVTKAYVDFYLKQDKALREK